MSYFITKWGVVKVFSLAHILIVLGIIAIIYFSKYLAKYVIKNNYDKQYRYTLAIVMTILEVAFNIWSLVNKGFTKDLLPFELCSVVMWVTVVALLIDSKKLIKIVTPWGLLGAFLAVIFFDMGGDYAFYEFRFWHFFGLHTLFVASDLYYFYSGKIDEYTKKDSYESMAYLFLYATVIFIFNQVADFNYLFLKELPSAASFIHDFIKAPFHVIPLVLVFGITVYSMRYLFQYIINKAQKV
ncbi:MAG: TIGR02206 family membrane protein [Acholeplasma sp.]|nr:TIGR02206 family membrane protein [Acholeplasma sp.]